jgi:SEP domain
MYICVHIYIYIYPYITVTKKHIFVFMSELSDPVLFGRRRHRGALNSVAAASARRAAEDSPSGVDCNKQEYGKVSCDGSITGTGGRKPSQSQRVYHQGSLLQRLAAKYAIELETECDADSESEIQCDAAVAGTVEPGPHPEESTAAALSLSGIGPGLNCATRHHLTHTCGSSAQPTSFDFTTALFSTRSGRGRQLPRTDNQCIPHEEHTLFSQYSKTALFKRRRSYGTHHGAHKPTVDDLLLQYQISRDQASTTASSTTTKSESSATATDIKAECGSPNRSGDNSLSPSAAATNTNAVTTASRDAFTAVSKRLVLVEKALRRQVSLVQSRDHTIRDLTRQLSAMRANSKQGEHTVVSKLVQVQRYNEQLEMQVYEMEKFLADYNLQWCGFRAQQHGIHSESETQVDQQGTTNDEASHAHTHTHAHAQPHWRSRDHQNSGEEHTVSHQQEATSASEQTTLSKTIFFDMGDMKHAIEELNVLAGEGTKRMVRKGNLVRFEPPPQVSLMFFQDGMLYKSGPLRPYNAQTCRAFIHDILDRFFPWELRNEFPDGVVFQFADRSDVKHTSYLAEAHRSHTAQAKASAVTRTISDRKTVVVNGAIVHLNGKQGPTVASSAPSVTRTAKSATNQSLEESAAGDVRVHRRGAGHVLADRMEKWLASHRNSDNKVIANNKP